MQQHLLVDGDDTLWENNIYFEEAIEDFIDFLGHSTLRRDQVRAALDEIELRNSQVFGYGSASFARNLRECYERLSERDRRQDDLDHVMRLGERILQQPTRLLSSVQQTVEYLCKRHELTLFTKGQPEEQRSKIERSGLARYFHHTIVVSEKTVGAYRDVVRERHLDPGRTWMIGNSPKSDINPALKAGINAVFVPHAATWGLERQELVTSSGRLLILERFAQLRDHF